MTTFGWDYWEHPYLIRENEQLLTDYPERYEQLEFADPTKYAVTCKECGTHYKEWVCDDATWQKLPLEHRRKRMCVACFRRLSVCPF